MKSVSLLAALLFPMACLAAELTTPKVGDQAPAISAVDQEGKPWNLEDFRNKKQVLLYFYPKDDTPGCTKQACGLRDEMAEFESKDVEVVGVSFDSAESHKKFIQKHNLNFRLLPDPDGKISDAYGVRVPSQPRA